MFRRREQRVTRALALLTRFLEVLVATLVAGVVLVVSAQVGVRYLLNASFDWSEEVARILLVWLTCVGAALAMQRSAHVRVELVGPLLPPRARAWLEVALDLLMLLFLAVLLVKGVSLIRISHTVVTPALSIPTSVVHAAPWVGALAIVPYLIRDTRAHLVAAMAPAARGAADATQEA
jgi:TRAP-type C4-dicarboxylate transport system permease small subunit